MSFSGLDSERVQRGRYSFLFAARKAHQLVRPRVGAPPSGHDGMVSQLFGRNLFSPELLGLWCIEALGSGLVAYLLLSADLADGAAGNLLRQHAASQVAQAAVLALTLGLVSFVVGMYSRDLYGETRRLLVGTALGGGIALPAIWLAGRAAGIDFDAMAGEGVLPLEALAGWALFVLTVRLAFSHAIRANLFVRRVLVVGAGPDDTAATRLGLVELRAFEMPPHARMSLAQQLLVRALISRFWKEPYRNKLIPWGTALHDRYLLPHFLELDWRDVLRDLRNFGYAFQDEWFAPHFEFRFPLIGSVTAGDLTLELRHALEPWNVLGEEASGGGTARNVDSSVERLQVKVTGGSDRYTVLCNGRPVPTPIGGVRYRAWQPPSCLHPGIPVHSPLVFDIVDAWSSRSIAGCTYHVAHPGGRANEEFPVNSLEAESRRLARFSTLGHTPGPMTVPPREVNEEFPFTLDLRRKPRA